MGGNTWTTELRRGLVEFCVLKLIAAGPSYGYEVVRRLREIDILAISECNVYPILSRCLGEGYLRVYSMKSEAGPPRRYYALTARGRSRLQEMNATWRALVTVVDHLDEQDQKGSATH